MSLKWCWAFGQESSALLQSDMGWVWGNTSTGTGQPTNTITYTYAGSPGRYSWSQDDGGANSFTLPATSFTPQGWVSIAFYADGTAYNFSRLIEIRGGTSGRSIYLQGNGAAGMSLYVDNVFKETFTLPLNDWQYVSLQYDFTATLWEGRAYVNGAAATAAYTDSRSAETTGITLLAGCVGGTRASLFAQIAIYDDTADAGQTPYYCTRVAPDTDTSTVGTWVPTGADNHSSTNTDPFSAASYTEEATPSSGDQVVTSLAALNTALGVTAGTVVGCTAHTYSSGTAVQAFAAVRDSGGSYAVGATVTPDTPPDTTYAFATQTAGFTGTSTINFKYEIV